MVARNFEAGVLTGRVSACPTQSRNQRAPIAMRFQALDLEQMYSMQALRMGRCRNTVCRRRAAMDITASAVHLLRYRLKRTRNRSQGATPTYTLPEWTHS